MMDEKLTQDCMMLILYAGEGKTLATEAFRLLMDHQDSTEAKSKIEEAGRVIGQAHDIQTRLIQDEINGVPIEKSVLLIHAQDHFMTAITFRDMVALLIDMYGKAGGK
ncbi:hypothetical protein P22_1357 [Propionispora sp. 2/2-37]|uniref:PTS lactose/cellobiose transporter subunit IIA n=1 Tax=Propionispora sp. 2/2-37 TaxID=1677858 RepID=UPI0006C169A1|nr:PTS lactose/cellobiose transporter subunit IIA [Propionispora sp. 2/2-37]CUH95287.1 hypothetical protein P22_1357 [Propionispora sp. 2/2-37]